MLPSDFLMQGNFLVADENNSRLASPDISQMTPMVQEVDPGYRSVVGMLTRSPATNGFQLSPFSTGFLAATTDSRDFLLSRSFPFLRTTARCC